MHRHTLTRFALISGFLGVTFAPSVQAEPPAPAESSRSLQFDSPISASDVRPHIELLASPQMKGRSGESALVAATYIRSKFKKLELRPLFADDRFFQQIPGVAGEDGKRPIAGRNVGGWIRGSDPDIADEFVIISAHYDHLGVRNGQIFTGADDNATGVAMMLEVARLIAAAEIKPRRSIAFVGFDLEERMLWGSRWFAAHPPWPLERLKLFITADMIGRSLGNLPISTVFVMGSEHATQLKTTLDEVGSPRGLETARMGIDLIGTRSDYGPFWNREIPFLFFSTGQHPDYHTPRDVAELINYDNVARVSGLVLRVAQTVANADDSPEWIDVPDSDLDEVRSLNRIATLLLETGNEQNLNGLQRLLVSQARNKTGQILKRGSITRNERTWLIRMAQLMLLSIF